MKKILLCFSLFVSQAYANVVYCSNPIIDFSDITYEEASEFSSDENKLIFVNFNTPEDKQCELMANSTYLNDNVISILNTYYISVNADINIESGKDWTDRFNVACLPTLMVLDPEGVLIGMHQGYLSTQSFTRWLGSLGVPNQMDAFVTPLNTTKNNSSSDLYELNEMLNIGTKPVFTQVQDYDEVEIKILTPFPLEDEDEAKANKIIITKSKVELAELIDNSFSFTPDKKEETPIERVPIPKAPHIVSDSEAKTISYSIQIGAFEKYVNAKKYIEKGTADLEGNYYILEEIGSDGKKLYKVVVGGFASKSEANNSFIQLKDLGYDGFLRRL